MKHLAQLFRRIGDALGWPRLTVTDPACVICQQGPNPALGVPIHCLDGLHRHWLCMVVGYRMGAVAKGAEMQVASQPPMAAVADLRGAISPRVTVN